VRAPYQSFKPHSKVVALGDGTTRGVGWPVAEWHFSVIPKAERDILKALVPSPALSAEVYLRTLNEDLEWHTYRAVMAWPPDPPDVQNDSSLKLTIEFKILEEID